MEEDYLVIYIERNGNINLCNGTLRLEYNGDIYVNGRLAENDKEVVDKLREFLNKLY